MKKQDYYNFLKISGVEDSFVQEALSFILKGGLESNGKFYDGRYKSNRIKHLSLIMLNKYLELLKKDREGDTILKWWSDNPFINKNLKGELHVHSSFSDGTGRIDELVSLAEDIGYKWIGISDHSPLNGNPLRLSSAAFTERHREIIKLREKSNIVIYEALEADISKDGSLMFPDSFRDSLDFVIASLHENIVNTEQSLLRIESALSDPLVIAFTHPYFGVQFPVSHPYIKDLLQIIKSKGKAVEINLAPQFLKNNLELSSLCRKMQISVIFSTDSHFVASLNLMRFASIYYPGIVSRQILNLQDSIK